MASDRHIGRPSRERAKARAQRGASAPLIAQYRPRGRHRRRRPVLPWVLIALVVALGAWAGLRFFQGPPERESSEQSAAATPAGSQADRREKTKAEKQVIAARKAVKVSSYLGGTQRRLEGFGPAPKNLNLVWKLRIGGGPTQRKADNAPVIWSGTGWTGQPTVVAEKGKTWLLLGGYDHNLHRINAATGNIMWESEWPDVMKGTNTIVANPAPAKKSRRIIVVSGSRRGSDYAVGDERIAPLRAVSYSSGKELWRLPVPKSDGYTQDVDSSPLWYKGVLYAPVESGYVYALDPFTTVEKNGHRTPKILARSPRLYEDADARAHPDIGGANIAIESSPAAIGDVIYVTSGAGHVYGLDRRTLQVVWDYKTGSDIDGTPVVTSDDKLLLTLEKQYIDERGGALLLDPSKPPKESVVWYHPTPTRGFGEWEGGSVGSFTTNEGSNDGSRPRLGAFNTIDGPVRVVSLDRTTKKRADPPGPGGKAPAPVEVFAESIGGSISTPVIVGDYLVTAGYGRRVVLYRFDYGEAEKGDDGALPSPDGRWWTVSVKQVDAFTGGAAFESTPLVYRGRVYIGCRDGYLYCLGM
ncbi:MAG TPA: PQQ-binding-like beta-propeller repeat protein [Coriobacteriia bacterium]|nr:PQQ-binding-like beta-propeller repeat protein [Coriobacteriia bacterium]